MLEQLRKRRQEEGFTLVELLIVIVIIGILAAVVIVAIGGITDSGEDAACKGSQDAAEAASVAFFSTQTGATPWADEFTDLTGAGLLDVGDVTVTSATVLTGKGWTLTMAGGGATAPTFTCANV